MLTNTDIKAVNIEAFGYQVVNISSSSTTAIDGTLWFYKISTANTKSSRISLFSVNSKYFVISVLGIIEI